MSNKVYDVLKYIALVFYPAVVVLVGTILTALSNENTEVILIIMTAVETFLGTILGISNVQYKVLILHQILHLRKFWLQYHRYKPK